MNLSERSRSALTCFKSVGLAAVCLFFVASFGCQTPSGNSSSGGASSPAPAASPERQTVQVKVVSADSSDGDTVIVDYGPKDKYDRIPDWVINPGLDGVTGAIGVAAETGLGTKEQLDEARLNARIELANMLEARLQRVGRTELEENFTSTGPGNRTEDSRKQILGIDRNILDMVLAGSRQRALWFDADNNEVYVWFVLDGSVLDAVSHSVTDEVSVFVASKPITKPFVPVRKKLVAPKIVVEVPSAPPPAPKPEPEKTPIEQLEGNLKDIETIPLKEGEAGTGQ